MDQRRDPRFVIDQSVMLTILREPQTRISARVANVSARGLGVNASSPVMPGTALKIALEDSLVLGEAVYCKPEADAWFIGIELNQVLAGLAELARRLQEYAPGLGGQSVNAVNEGYTQNR